MLKILKAIAAFVCKIKKTMATTRAAPRRNLRRRPGWVAAAVAARLQRPTGGIGVKNIENIRRRNKDIKIRRLIPQSKHIEVKHRGRVVRKMTVRRHAIFPEIRHEREY